MDEFEIVNKELNKLAPYIGRLVIAFTSLEELLTMILCELIHDHDEGLGLIVTSNYNYSGKVELFNKLLTRELIALEKEEYLKELGELVENLKQAGEKRNNAIHGAWHGIDIKRKKIRTKLDKKSMKEIEPRYKEMSISKKDLREIENFIEDLESGLDDFWERRAEWLNQF